MVSAPPRASRTTPAAADVQSSRTGRLLFVDNLRVFLTILMVLFHLMITYAGTGSWYYTEGGEDFLTGAIGAWFLTVTQSYFMGLFLLISAYFVPGSYDRKGAGRFLKDRLIRLGIPLALYSWLIRPALAYLDPVRFPVSRPSFWSFITGSYFLVVVVMGKHQVAAILPTLAANQQTPTILFLHNNAVTFPALYEFWQHQLIVGLIVTFVPSILVSALVMRYANLEPYKESRLGRYIRRYMSPLVVALRLIGLLVMCIGAWLHMLWLIPVGIIIVILAWLRGLVFPTYCAVNVQRSPRFSHSRELPFFAEYCSLIVMGLIAYRRSWLLTLAARSIYLAALRKFVLLRSWGCCCALPSAITCASFRWCDASSSSVLGGLQLTNGGQQWSRCSCLKDQVSQLDKP